MSRAEGELSASLPSEHQRVDGLRTDQRGAVLEITLDRPERRNALTPGIIAGFMDLLAELRQTPQTRVILLTGAGEKAFCAGFDIEMINSVGGGGPGVERDLVDDLATSLQALPQPIVAAVNGAAVGAGCDLAVACDIRIGTSASRFGMPPAKLGILYATNGIQRLVRTVGPAAAKELLLTGALIDAERARTLGLLSQVVPSDQLLGAAREVADEIAANAPLSVTASKQVVDLLAGAAGQVDRTTLDEIQRTAAHWYPG